LLADSYAVVAFPAACPAGRRREGQSLGRLASAVAFTLADHCTTSRAGELRDSGHWVGFGSLMTPGTRFAAAPLEYSVPAADIVCVYVHFLTIAGDGSNLRVTRDDNGVRAWKIASDGWLDSLVHGRRTLAVLVGDGHAGTVPVPDFGPVGWTTRSSRGYGALPPHSELNETACTSRD
jgi:hypothetical protein